jgi:maltose O-acetyltransferase
MLSGEPYRADDPELVAGRRGCQRLIGLFNEGRPDDERSRQVLRQLLGSLGEGSEILPRFQCDYDTQITIGARCFISA